VRLWDILLATTPCSSRVRSRWRRARITAAPVSRRPPPAAKTKHMTIAAVAITELPSAFGAHLVPPYVTPAPPSPACADKPRSCRSNANLYTSLLYYRQARPALTANAPLSLAPAARRRAPSSSGTYPFMLASVLIWSGGLSLSHQGAA
jgi:hypothetical protein